MRPYRFILVGAVLSIAVSAHAALNVGDKAPELKVATWVKGAPVEIGKGKPVVVEFWATWCGPCKSSIPHLTEMAKKFAGKVDFVGVSIFESKPEDYKTKVPAFVKSMGDKMGYSVATDSANSHMGNAWFKATGEGGIPAAIVVDGSGKVAWIGHPMDGLDQALDDLVAGKLDIDAVRKAREKAKSSQREQSAQQKEFAKKFEAVMKCVAESDFKGALVELDKLWEKQPKLRGHVARMEMGVRQMGKLGGIDKAFEKLEGLPDMNDPEFLSSIFLQVTMAPDGVGDTVFKKLVPAGEKMMKLAPKSATNTASFAQVLWLAGEKERARPLIKQALELAEAEKGLPEWFVESIRAKIKEYGG